MERLATISDLALRFSVHPETVRQWVRQGKIPALRVGRGCIRFDLAVIEKSLQSTPMAIHSLPQGGL